MLETDKQRRDRINELYSMSPVRRGAIYCAPWCGANCTWAKFQEVTRKAKALAKLLGPGWKPRVWENMGWFYEVRNGLLEMKTDQHRGKTTYSLWCQSRPQIIGDNCSTPELAVKALGLKMQAHFEQQYESLLALAEAYKNCAPKAKMPKLIQKLIAPASPKGVS